MARVFILSPARSDGVRAGYLANPKTSIAMGLELQANIKQPIGKVFTFLSGLYFRGKVAYAERFSASAGLAASPSVGAWVITSNQGLLPLHAPIGLDDLQSFSRTPIALGEPRYEEPLRRDLARLISDDNSATEYVLLGSVSTDKYTEALVSILGERVLFPVEFLGRGDMSRGALMLRQSRVGEELEYAPLAGILKPRKRLAKATPVARKGTGYGKFP
jgi:hypothetical protein